MKKLILLIATAISFLLLIITVGYTRNTNKATNIFSTSLNVFDSENIPALTGFADNVFVAKVISEEGTYYENVTNHPNTIYSLSVIENIKGTLPTDDLIKVYKHGGVNKDGSLYIPEEDVFVKVGEYYLFITAIQGASTDSEKKIMTMPEGSLLIIQNGLYPLGQKEGIALSSDKVKGFESAFDSQEEYSRIRYPLKETEVILTRKGMDKK